jgi:4-amino-4-deoxy-L-arabinose transferase-like glycosyltransferase
MAASFGLFGGSTFALRLPSALCGLAVVALAIYWGGRWFNRRLAILAGLIVATTFGFLSHHGARSGDFDALLTLILLLVAVQLPALGESPWRVLAVAPLFALGFLLKSFAVAPMMAVTACFLLWTGGWRRQRWVPCLAACALFAGIVGVWALARWQADGSPDFLLRVIREDLVLRSTRIVDKSTSSPFAYATALLDRFAPWPLVMLGAAAVALATRTRPVARDQGVVKLLALWVFVPLVVISLVRTQHHWYLDPLYPALAMIAAASALFLIERQPVRWRSAATVGLLVLPLLLCEGRLLGRVLLKEPMSGDQRFLVNRKADAAACRELWTTFELRYAERFLLEVADGFQVVEAGERSSPLGRPATACLLVGKRAWRRPPAPPADQLPPPGLLRAEGADFAFYAAAAPERTADARLSAPRH